MIELFLCDARRQIRSIVYLCEVFGVRRTRAKRANQNNFPTTKKLLMSEEILCEARSRVHSIVDLCEQLDYR